MDTTPGVDRYKTKVINFDQALDEEFKTDMRETPAALVVIGGDLTGTIFDLTEAEMSVGRSIENNIPMEFEGISRQHFKLVNHSDAWKVLDTGSTNGTYLGEQKLETNVENELTDGQIINVGPHAFKYLEAGSSDRLTYESLHHKAHHDGHTGCYNKAFFNNKIDIEVRRSQENKAPLSVIMLDIDHFKRFNDTYGHDAGDYVLTALADLIRTQIREDDVLFARYGGEEFVLLFCKTEIQQCFDIAERLRKSIEDYSFEYGGQRLSVTASFGVATFRDETESGVHLFKMADKALYLSKESGRNQVRLDSEL